MKDILHCDLNNFYASCEILRNPELKDKPIVVGGDEDGHGVVVAKNYIAKDRGIKTGMSIWQAKKVCPDVVVVDSDFKLYSHYSRLVRHIYLEYTDLVEPFSIDECWLDVTHSKIFGTPEEIANKIRTRVKQELGLTISVGVSFNKVFAKLGSDLKKPDATTIISYDNFKNVVWPLNVSDMIGIGKKTYEKLKKYNINTIGELAKTDKNLLLREFGKVGKELWDSANGLSDDNVMKYDTIVMPKSVGNSTTFYNNLTEEEDIYSAFSVLCEHIVERMIKYNIQKAKTISIVVKDKDLNIFQKQTKLNYPCRNSNVFTETAMNLYKQNFSSIPYIRLLGVTATDFLNEEYQLSFFETKDDQKDIDKVMLNIRQKFGHSVIKKASTIYNKQFSEIFDGEDLEKKDRNN